MTNKGHKNSNPSPSEDANQTQHGCLSHPALSTLSGRLYQKVHNVWDNAFWYVSVDFSFAANTDKPQCCYRYCQPETLCSSWVFHASLVPLPATTLDGSEALLYPCSHAIPPGITCFSWQVSENEPGFFCSFFPVCQESSWNATALEGHASNSPALSWFSGKALDGQEAPFSCRTECATSVDSHEWMPSHGVNMPEKLWGIQTPICQDNDGVMAGDTGSDQLEHTKPMSVPFTLGVAFGDSPGYWYGTTTVDHTYTEHSEVQGEGSGIQSNSHLSSLPPVHHPAHQEGEATLNLNVNTLFPPLVFSAIAPFAQSLTHGVFLDFQKSSQEKHDRC